MDDRLQVEQRRLEQGIDYNEVEVAGLRHLDARIGQALGDRVGAVLAAAQQPLAQLVPARRQHEDEHGVREQLLDLQRALPVDLEHDVLARADALPDRRLRRSVALAVYLGPFEELAALDHGGESGVVDEVVFAPRLLLAARRARRVRDRDDEVRIELEQRLHEARLAGAAGCGDDEQVARGVHAVRGASLCGAILHRSAARAGRGSACGLPDPGRKLLARGAARRPTTAARYSMFCT